MARPSKLYDYLPVLRQFAKWKKNLLLIGRHGVGKTQMVDEVFTELFKRDWVYFSGSTLDPHVDIGGIPFPEEDDQGVKFMRFLRSPRVWNAKAIMIDELNRSHHKVRNYLMEMIQFKSLNGEKLPNLELVWAGINPPNDEQDYAVENLDPALQDRFHGSLTILANPKLDVLTKLGVEKDTAKTLISWWRSLSPKEQIHVSPRRLQYVGEMWDVGIDINLAFDADLINCKIPLAGLLSALKKEITVEEFEEITGTMDVQWFLKNHNEAQRLAQSPRADRIYTAVKGLPYNDVKKISTILMAFPGEMKNNIVTHFKKDIDADTSTNDAFLGWAKSVRDSMTVKP